MEELGAEVDKFREVLFDGKFIQWRWWLKRKGAGNCMVTLYQYQKVEYADVAMLQDDFLPEKAYTHAPDLNRVAVVSAPVVDEEEKPIAQRLNENVSQALENAKAVADKKGFLPDYDDFKHLGEGKMTPIRRRNEYIYGQAVRRLGVMMRDLLDRTQGSWGGGWMSVGTELALG